MQGLFHPAVLAALVPLMFALVIYLVEKRSWRLRNGLSVLASLVSFALVISHYKRIMTGETILVELDRKSTRLNSSHH